MDNFEKISDMKNLESVKGALHDESVRKVSKLSAVERESDGIRSCGGHIRFVGMGDARMALATGPNTGPKMFLVYSCSDTHDEKVMADRANLQ